MSEQYLLNEGSITITDKRIVILTKTYSVSNITSVDLKVTRQYKSKAPVILLNYAITYFLMGLVFQFNIFAMIFFGTILGMITLGIYQAIYNGFNVYNLILKSNAGEIQALSSKDRDWIIKITAAINRAIANNNVQSEIKKEITIMDAEVIEETNDTKECPQCAETVKAKAKICRFCNYQFEELNSAL